MSINDLLDRKGIRNGLGVARLEKIKADKEKVLAKWPDAYSDKASGQHLICLNENKSARILGYGNTEPEAWADAARRLDKDAGQKIIDHKAMHERLTGEST